MRMMRRAAALIPAGCALLGLAGAETGTIVFQDGGRGRGDVPESPAEIVLTTPYGTRRFSRANVQRIEYDSQDGGRASTHPATTQPTSRPSSGPAGDQKNGEASSRPVRSVLRGPVPPPPL